MKKSLSLLLAGTLLLSGCSTEQTTQSEQTTPAQTEASTEASTEAPTETASEAPEEGEGLKDGTYTATGSGYGGDVEVALTVTDGKMSGIEITGGNETSLIQNRMLPVLEERILEAQSPVVDSVSGATFTSYAVKKAVADAAKEAGVDFGEITMATAGPEEAAQELEAVETDLVIVGGGPAGLGAAIAASDAGLMDIIVVEKLDILGGNGKFDMNFFDLINSQAMIKAGNEMTKEEFIASKESSWDSPERIQAWADGEWELDEWLRSYGVELNYNYGGTNHMAEADAYAGEEILDGMEAKVKELGIDVRTGTKGYDLIIDDSGKVTGVKVQNKNNTYDINAKAVIIATGGFCYNKELLAEYAPGYEVLNTSNQMGATGDFVKVFEKNGYALDHMDTMSVFSNIIVPRRDLTGGADLALEVNAEGELMVHEGTSLDRGKTILEQTGKSVFYITDQTGYDSFYRIRKHVGLGYYSQGETLADLAEALGIDKEQLQATVDEYNSNLPEGKRAFDQEGPFYGVKVEAANHMTKGGVLANENAQVLTTENEVVEGLYAAGEVTSTSGAYSAAVVFGRISGTKAAEYILGE